MQSVSNHPTTLLQVASNPSLGHSLIAQNGQRLLLGKLSKSGLAASMGGFSPTEEVLTETADAATQGATIFPAHYLETAGEQTVYATSGTDGQIQYQEYTPIIYTPVCGGPAYYQTLGNQVLSNSAFCTSDGGLNGHTQLVTHQGATYILQTGGHIEEDPTNLSHTAKASPLTVQWLVENYETAEGVSLPRSTLYFHYLQHCHENKLEPMNPASFGKLIRSIFLGLRTRRLGTRGNSKYHYYGIRIKPSSHLNHYIEDPAFALRHYPNYHRQSMEVVAAEWKSLASASGHLKAATAAAVGLTTSSPGGPRLAVSLAPASTPASGGSAGRTTCSSRTEAQGHSRQHQHAQFLGEASSALPNLDEICRSAGLPIPGIEEGLQRTAPAKYRCLSGATSGERAGSAKRATIEGVPADDIVAFACMYAHSAASMLDAVVNLDFAAIVSVWKTFWRTDGNQEDSELECLLPRQRLHSLTKSEAVRQFIRLYDHTFYQSLAEVLIPNVLRPIPPSLTQAIRNFAKSLEAWMQVALQDLDAVLLRIKLSAVSALAQTLRRYTSLNHLAQAARAVLKNASQINQMLVDLNRVDFNNVQEQASWVCQCSDATVSRLEQDFKSILQKQSTLEEWAQWLDSVVTTILHPLEGNNLAYTRAAHQLILKWSFYSSMVIRDLTLRSAASFGSFHLIRLLYDEYIFYLVEHKVAAHLGMTPVAVMGEMGRAVTISHATSRSVLESSRRRESKMFVNRSEEEPMQMGASAVGGSEEVAASRGAAVLGVRPDSREEDSMEQQQSSALASPTKGVLLEDEEVDEYLDDEEEEMDDSAGDESVMLRRAHESAQALCRVTASGPMDSARASLSSLHPGSGHTASAEEGEGSRSEQPLAPNNSEVSLRESLTSRPQPTRAGEGCDSPPPIITITVPTRKVVRVTTFDGTEQAVSSSPSTPPIHFAAGLSLTSSPNCKRFRLS